VDARHEACCPQVEDNLKTKTSAPDKCRVRTTPPRHLRLALFAVVFFSLLAVVTAQAHAATVATDYPDYAPGEIVTITGTGWQPLETVVMVLHEEPETHLDVTVSSVVDANGNFTNTDFSPNESDVGRTFTVTATGLSSGLTALTTFTDAGDGCTSDAFCAALNTNPCKTNAHCNLSSTNCSYDNVAAGTACTDDGNACTDDVCGSTSNAGTCIHPAKANGTVCRAADGACDVAETCNGTTAACPADGFRAAGFECRAANGACDVHETCTGSSAACPADAFLSSATVCRGSAGACDVAENCTGASAACPADAKLGAETTCRASAGVCDQAEVCSGGNDCPADGFLSSATVCRGSAGACDVAENCTGSGAACPVDAFKASTVECRGSAGACDVAENCTGSGAACPTDGFKAASVECRAAADFCDEAEKCDGLSAACPDDTRKPCSFLTDGSLCAPLELHNLEPYQFRLILTPDQSSPYKLNASNPGQFFYNIVYCDSGGSSNITLPYPFVTQGAVPIHFYDGVTFLDVDGQTCLIPGTEFENDSTQVTLGNYSSQQVGIWYDLPVTLPSPPPGCALITVHLDYGLKKMRDYMPGAENAAIDAGILAGINPTIPDEQEYMFDSIGGDYTVESVNVFKHDPGIGGLVRDGTDPGIGNPVEGVKVEISSSDSKKTVSATVYTDQDGWYMWQYKYTGKAATFTVSLPDYVGATQSVTLKSNGYVIVNFDVDVPDAP